ncbi:MAG: DNA recombination protein RmuC [Prevotellaceae bacterium]|nr:DNA recombination protein RmuC [Prevotellaceae bacterium]
MAVAFVFLLVGLVLGLVVGMLLTKSRMLEEKTSLVASRNVLQNETDQLRRQLSEQEKRHTSQIDELRQQQKEQLEQQSALIREQINNASEQILKKRAEELQRNNTEQLSTILTPLHERLQQMREAVEKSERGQSLAMERLDAVIKENLRQVHEVGERADKLAEALTSENKTQGDFGELRLRTLLINMGLEEGVQFEEQATMRDERGKTIYEEENGRRMMPDVILHFPDDRDVIIDSKMSLKAFEEYFNAESEEDKARALTRHIASVRSHVKELAHKNYSSFIRKGRQKLDFVLMYVYSESALQLALANDVTLWKEAYDQGVVISGSQNLYMILRVLEMTWRQVRQAENQEEIMKVADEVVNRVQMFYERFLDVEDQLEKTRKAFDSLKTNTSPSGKSIITAASKLLDYGAKENPKRKVSLGAAYRD